MANDRISQIKLPSNQIYDINAKFINGHTVATDVPNNAIFTDTTYSALSNGGLTLNANNEFSLINNSITINTHSVALGGSLTLTATDVNAANSTHTHTASDLPELNNVTQNAAITTSGNYPIILGTNTETTALTGYLNKAAALTYNPNNTILTTPHLTISNVAAHSHLTFSRTTWNYITGPAESVIAFNFGTIGANDSTFAVSATSASPGKDNTYDLGESSTRWHAIYANNYVPRTRTTTTLSNTAGTYSFALTATISQINSSSNHYVGLLIGDDDSKWLITNLNNTLWFRLNSNGGTSTAWENWTQVLDTSLLDNTISTTIDASHIPTTLAVVNYIAGNAGASIEIIRL